MLGILFVNNNDEWLASPMQAELHSTPGFSGGGLGCSLEQSRVGGCTLPGREARRGGGGDKARKVGDKEKRER